MIDAKLKIRLRSSLMVTRGSYSGAPIFPGWKRLRLALYHSTQLFMKRIVFHKEAGEKIFFNKMCSIYTEYLFLSN